MTGRPQLGLLATTVADLNLRIAIVLSELKLPAAIERHVLAAAMQDFIDEVKPTDADDWLTLVRSRSKRDARADRGLCRGGRGVGPLVPAAAGTFPGITKMKTTRARGVCAGCRGGFRRARRHRRRS